MVLARFSNWCVVLLPLTAIPAAQAVERVQTFDAAGLLATDATGLDSAAKDTQLLNRVRRVLDQYYRRPPNTRDDSPWELLHWSIAYGIDAQVKAGGPQGEQVSAIGWLCENRPSAGIRLMSQGRDGMVLSIAPGKQGHAGQFLAMLAQAEVKPDFGVRVGNERLTVGDLVMHERLACRTGQELTFKLIGITHFGSTDGTWKNNRGETWSVRRLLEEELMQPIRSQSTCGGTHRLFALSYAVQRRRSEALPLDGPWEKATRRVTEYQARAFRMQNRDGRFSTAWLDRPASSTSANRRLTTSGHVAEWLAFSLSDEELQDVRFEKGLNYLSRLLETHRPSSSTWGAMSHALHAFAIYERRMSGVKAGMRRKDWMEAGLRRAERGTVRQATGGKLHPSIRSMQQR